MPRLFTGSGRFRPRSPDAFHLRGGLPGARWIDPENYHVTLRFIGDIDGVVRQRDRLDAGSRQPQALRRYGCRALTVFGGKKPRAVVAAVEPTQALMDCRPSMSG